MQFLKANTQVVVTVGPFVDVGDGFTPQTDIALAGNEAELLKHGSDTVVDISAATWVAVANCRGYYSLTLTTDHTDTEGLLVVIVQDDSDCLPVKQEFMVLAEAAWDSLFAAKDTGYMDVHGKTLEANVITATAINGDAITSAKIADDAFSAEHFNTGAFTADAFAADALVAATFATDAITTDALADGTITAAKLGADAITSAKIADDAISAEHLNTGALTADAFAADALVAATFATGAFTADAFAADALVAATFATGAFTADAFAANAIVAATLAADCITEAKIADNAIAAEHIAAAAIDNATFAADVGSTAYATNIIAIAVRKALDEIKLDHLVAVADADDVVDDSVLAKMAATAGDWSTFVDTTDSLQSIRDAIGASSDSMLLQSGTITVTDQTHFTLSAGSADDDAYLNMICVFTDAVTGEQKSVRTVTAYTGATTTVTIDSAPDFVIATGDGFKMVTVAPGSTPPTAAAIADAVWDEAGADHVAADTMGAQVETKIDAIPTTAMRGTDGANTTTPPTAAAVADAVWDEPGADHVAEDSMGAQVETKVDAILADTGTDGVKVGADAIGAAQIADNAIAAEHLNTGALTADAFAADAIVAATLATGALTADAFAANALVAATFAADCITSAKIADDAIRTEHVHSDALDAILVAVGGANLTLPDAVKLAARHADGDYGVVGTLLTVKDADGEVATYTLDNADNPTSRTKD